MNQTYRHKNTSVSLANYHFCWIVRRRRKVLTGCIKQRLDVLIHDVARELDCEVLSLAIESEHVHLFINSPPDIAPSELMHQIKGRTARFLRKEFPELMKLPSMWTRAYFVSTAGNVASTTIQKYIEAQGKDWRRLKASTLYPTLKRGGLCLLCCNLRHYFVIHRLSSEARSLLKKTLTPTTRWEGFLEEDSVGSKTLFLAY